MPAAKRPSNKKKQSFFSRLIPKTRKAKIITTVALFAIVGGGFMVYRSFAATTANYTSGVMNWRFDGSRKYSNRVSSNGTICVDSLGINLSDWGADTHYAVRLFTLVNGKWQQSRVKNFRFSDDVNRTNYERVCWRGLTSAYLYRIQFDPIRPNVRGFFDPADRAYARLTYKIYGYDVEKGETSATSKNPNNTTPAPAPAPAPPAQTSKNPR